MNQNDLIKQSYLQQVKHCNPKTNLVASITPSGKILYISTNCRSLTGYKQHELIGTYLKNYIHRDDSFLVEGNFFNQNHSQSCLFRFKIKDLTYCWFNVEIESIYQVDMEACEEILLKMNVIDVPEEYSSITLSQEKHSELPVTDAMIKTTAVDELSERSPIPLIISHHNKIMYLNDAAVKLLSIKMRDSVIGKSIFAYIHKKYHPIVRKRSECIQKGLRIGKAEQTWLTEDSKKVEVELHTTYIFFNNLACEYNVLYDISSRKNFQAILQKSRERYERIVQNSIDTIAVVYNNNWVFINDSGVKLFEANNYSDMLGKNIYLLLHKNYHEHVQTMMTAVINSEKDVKSSKVSWYKITGGQIYTELVCIPTSYFGEPAVQIIIRDLSDRKIAEELMIKSEKLSIAGQLAAGIAHEIRNPLTAIKGFLQFMKSNEDSQYYSIIFSELNRIEHILSELLLLAKPHAVIYEKSDINLIIRDVATLIASQALLRNIEIDMVLSAEQLTIVCDSNQIKQVFINVLNNSIDAMEDGGKIEVITKSKNEMVEIIFKDNGCGIPQSLIGKIGEPFFTTKEKGTGLGLMVSYKIIEDHNGSIQIQSEENEGTIFKIMLPLSND